MVQSGQNSPEVFVCMSSIVLKMAYYFSLFLYHRISLFLVSQGWQPGELY